jgi:hypothetical protein
MTGTTSEAKTEQSRKRLLELIRSGHDVESASHLVGLSVASVEADPALMLEVAVSYRVATSRLRARLLSVAHEDADVRTLSKLLDGREERQRQLPTEPRDQGGDDGLAKRLAELSDAELAAFEWVLCGAGPRPERQLSYSDVMERLGQERAAGRADKLGVLDERAPLPRDRSLTLPEPPDAMQALSQSDPQAAFWWATNGPRG